MRARAARSPAAAAVAAVAAALGCADGVSYIGADCLPGGGEGELQAAIDARPTVLLCRRAVFALAAPLVLRQGVSVETVGRPADAAEMATIRLAPGFPTQVSVGLVGSGSDIHLRAVRLDGNRREIGVRVGLGLVELGPGGGYSVEGCVLDDAPGWTHLHLLEPCENATITDNVVESAVRPHADGAQLTDGMSLSCAHSLVERNRFDDVSSTGIVYFGGPGTTIRDNLFVEETTSGYSAINLGDAVVADHSGVLVEGNRVSVRGPRFLHVGIAVGLHVYGKTATIAGVTVRGNAIEGMARYGLAVDGCVDCTVDGNDVAGWQPAPPLDACPPPAAYPAAITAAHASGALQAGFSDEKIDGCLGEPDVLGPIFRTYAGPGVSFPEYLAFEVQTFSERMTRGEDAAALLRAEWDDLAARARAICPAGDAAAQQAVWLRIAEAQYAAGLAPAAADTRVRADLAAAPAGTACAP